MKKLNPLLLVSFICIFLLLLQCKNKDAVKINFLAGPDDTGTLKEIVDHFNDSYKGQIKVKFEEGPRSSTDHYNYIQSSLEAEKSEFDVFASDVVWTASIADKELAQDLSARFYTQFEPTDFLEASLNSAIYQHHVWGIPWFTDTGLLYYRKDLLSEAGYDKPPRTWKELNAIAKKIMKEKGIKYGFTFQGAQYEGGVTNFCEFVWNAGGQVMIGNLDVVGTFDQTQIDPNIITVNSGEAVRGLTDVVEMINEGIAPEDVYLFLEKETTEAFLNGDAIFMRNWPGVFGQLTSENSKVSQDQVGFSAIPVSKEGNASYSCLGGWNLMINAKSSAEEQEAAWTFIQYLVDPRRQKYRALVGGNLPSIRQLYDDEELLTKNTLVKEFKKIMPNARTRPSSPYYKELAPVISELYNQVLRQEIQPELAVFNMENRLQEIIESHRND
jgi:multiple sugar transport system substrate-binding protein